MEPGGKLKREEKGNKKKKKIGEGRFFEGTAWERDRGIFSRRRGEVFREEDKRET